MRIKVTVLLFLVLFLCFATAISSPAYLGSYDESSVIFSDFSLLAEMRKAISDGDEEAYSQIYNSLGTDLRIIRYDSDVIKATFPSTLALAESSFEEFDYYRNGFLMPAEIPATAENIEYWVAFMRYDVSCHFALSGWEILVTTEYYPLPLDETSPVVATLQTNTDEILEFRKQYYRYIYPDGEVSIDPEGHYYIAYIPIQGEHQNYYGKVFIRQLEETLRRYLPSKSWEP